MYNVHIHARHNNESFRALPRGRASFHVEGSSDPR
jgi:hypothetical protein